MNVKNKIRAGLAAAVLAVGAAVGGTAAPAQAAGSGPGGATGDELFYCVASWSCGAWQDAATWAKSTAQWRYPALVEQHNDTADAFRHCIWSGALANRIGYQDAYTLVMIHEDLVNDPMAEDIMDAGNDKIGLSIGIDSLSQGGGDQWGWIMNQCGQRADAHQLIGLWGTVGAY